MDWNKGKLLKCPNFCREKKTFICSENLAAASQRPSTRGVDTGNVTIKLQVIYYFLSTSPTSTTKSSWHTPPLEVEMSICCHRTGRARRWPGYWPCWDGPLSIRGKERGEWGGGGGGAWMDGWWGGKVEGWRSPRERRSGGLLEI